MNISTILTKKAGLIIPEAFLQHVTTKSAPNFFGFVVQDNGKLPVHHMSADNIGKDFFDNLKKLNENIKDNNALLFFGKGSFDKDSFQPYMLPDEQGNDFIAVGVEGDFGKFASGDANAETQFLCDWAGPRFQELYELCGGDAEKIISKLQGVMFADPFNEICGHRGVFSILGRTGAPVMFGKNELGGNYDWGSASQNHNYQEKVEAPPVEEKKSSGFNFFSKKSSTPATATETKPEEQPKETKPVETTPKVAPPTTPELKPGEELLYPPATVRGNNELKTWYRKFNNGDLPTGWKSRCAIVVKSKVGLDNLKEKIEEKQTTPSVSELPYLNQKEVLSAKDFVAKFLDNNSNTVTDPRTAYKIESKLPMFSEQLGIDLARIAGWPASAFVALGNTHPKALASLVLELRHALYGNADVKPGEQAPVQAPPAEEKPPITEPVKKVANGGFAFFSKKN